MFVLYVYLYYKSFPFNKYLDVYYAYTISQWPETYLKYLADSEAYFWCNWKMWVDVFDLAQETKLIALSSYTDPNISHPCYVPHINFIESMFFL